MALFARPGTADILDGMVDYVVDTPEGSAGILDGWKRDEHGRPEALIVAQGWFGRRRFEVPLEALRQIDHDDRRIILAPGTAPLESKGPLQRLVKPGHERPAEEAAAAVPRPGSEQARPVLCGVADDARAAAVVNVAALLARKLAAPLILAHVTPAHVPPGVSAAPEGQARLREEEKEDAHALLDVLRSPVASGISVEPVVARGMPAETLDALARRERAQLLVIGSSGKGSLGAALKGSVSQYLIGHARCPVLVVPPELTLRPQDDGGDVIAPAPDGSLAGVGRDGTR